MMYDTMWKVCPVQGRQLKDVRPSDLFEDFRICNTYRGGGGYDEFPEIAKRRGMKVNNLNKQFVVQLYGCHLRCPYCYVTKDGIFGKATAYSTIDLVDSFKRAQRQMGVGTFHLMGGAPALKLEHWPELTSVLEDELCVFHSDFLLTEGEYDEAILKEIAIDNSLYAVNIKGTNAKNYLENTGRDVDWELIGRNLERLLKCNVNFYMTFTNPDWDAYGYFRHVLRSRYFRYGSRVLRDSFVVELKDYESLKGGTAWK